MSELTEEQIKQAKREQMLQNLERGRKVRAENLKLAKQRNLKRNVESKEKESPKDTLEDNKSNKTESAPKTKTPPRDKSKFVCVCGKQLASKYSLRQHEGICKIYQEQTTELEETEEKPKEIEIEKENDEAVKSEDEDVEVQVIKRKKPKKKKVVIVEEEESEDEEPKNVIIKQAPKQEKPIPKKSIVPSAHNKHTHLQPDHFEKEERYTIAQFRAIVERENKKKQEKAIQDKRLKEDMRLKSIIENMRNGGI